MKFYLNIICLSLLLIVTPITAFADEITLMADPWCPYSCEPDSSKPGYAIEIAQKVFSKAGHTAKYIVMDWDEAVTKTRKGEYTAVVGAYKEDAPGFVFPKESVGLSGSWFFTLKDSKWRYTGVDSLKGVKVGVIKGYSYGDVLDKVFAEKDKAGEMFITSGVTALGMLIDNLVAGKIDTLNEDKAVFIDYLVDNGMFDILSNTKEAGIEGDPESVYIAFSPVNPKSKEYADILTKGIAELRKSGELAKILKKYEMKDWK
jgi:polar amino acid transport system substrate-binding protein